MLEVGFPKKNPFVFLSINGCVGNNCYNLFHLEGARLCEYPSYFFAIMVDYNFPGLEIIPKGLYIFRGNDGLP